MKWKKNVIFKDAKSFKHQLIATMHEPPKNRPELNGCGRERSACICAQLRARRRSLLVWHVLYLTTSKLSSKNETNLNKFEQENGIV